MFRTTPVLIADHPGNNHLYSLRRICGLVPGRAFSLEIPGKFCNDTWCSLFCI